MALVADYSSDASGASGGSEAPPPAVAARAGDAEASDSQDSYFAGSGSDSEDSAARRQREAEARLTNREEEVAGPSALDLPPPLTVIDGTAQPDFLRPEATRPLAKPFHRSRQPAAQRAAEAQPAQPDPGAARDIAGMAPRLKGQGEVGKRGLPAGAVISAAAKRYKPDESGPEITAAQVAMLGGQWQPNADAPDPAAEAAQARKKGPSKAMAVGDFLAKGEGASLLPRRQQERRDREKEKRQRGQSAIHGWKTEAEMVLRQQYD